MRLRMLVSRLRLHELGGFEIDVIMALAGAVDAIGPMQAGVEPLRRIGRGDLLGQHEAQFVVEGAGVRFGVEIFALPAPIGPGAGEPVEDLAGGDFGAESLGLRQLFQRLLVGGMAPEEFGNVGLFDRLQPRRDAGLAEIFLRQHVGRDLAPARRHVDAIEGETRSSRPDCGSRCGSCEIRSPHKAIGFQSCSAARFACFLAPNDEDSAPRGRLPRPRPFRS